MIFFLHFTTTLQRKLHLPHHNHSGLKIINSLQPVELLKYLGYMILSLGVNMFSQSAVRLEKSLTFLTKDFATMLQVPT